MRYQGGRRGKQQKTDSAFRGNEHAVGIIVLLIDSIGFCLAPCSLSIVLAPDSRSGELYRDLIGELRASRDGALG